MESGEKPTADESTDGENELRSLWDPLAEIAPFLHDLPDIGQVDPLFLPDLDIDGDFWPSNECCLRDDEHAGFPEQTLGDMWLTSFCSSFCSGDLLNTLCSDTSRPPSRQEITNMEPANVSTVDSICVPGSLRSGSQWEEEPYGDPKGHELWRGAFAETVTKRFEAPISSAVVGYHQEVPAVPDQDLGMWDPPPHGPSTIFPASTVLGLHAPQASCISHTVASSCQIWRPLWLPEEGTGRPKPSTSNGDVGPLQPLLLLDTGGTQSRVMKSSGQASDVERDNLGSNRGSPLECLQEEANLLSGPGYLLPPSSWPSWAKNSNQEQQDLNMTVKVRTGANDDSMALAKTKKTSGNETGSSTSQDGMFDGFFTLEGCGTKGHRSSGTNGLVLDPKHLCLKDGAEAFSQDGKRSKGKAESFSMERTSLDHFLTSEVTVSKPTGLQKALPALPPSLGGSSLLTDGQQDTQGSCPPPPGSTSDLDVVATVHLLHAPRSKRRLSRRVDYEDMRLVQKRPNMVAAEVDLDVLDPSDSGLGPDVEGGKEDECNSGQADSSSLGGPTAVVRGRRDVSFPQLQQVFGLPIEDAAKELGLGMTVLKKLCRQFQIKRWPYRRLASYDKVIQTVREKYRANPSEDIFETLEQLEHLKAESIKDPSVNLEPRFKKLRQAIFKEQYKTRQSVTASRRAY